MRPAVGWIGLGAIGAPMAKRALDAGFALSVWARRSGQADALVAAGARRCADPESLARACELVVTIVGGPDDAPLVASLLSDTSPAVRLVAIDAAARLGGALVDFELSTLPSRQDAVQQYQYAALGRHPAAVVAAVEARLTPLEIEFWHDRPFRLHDRVVFRRPDPSVPWKRDWLFP